MIKLLGGHNGFIVHASAIKVNNKVYIFIADSGGGKSTIVRLLHNAYDPLADDHCIIRKIRNKYYFYQNPFIEKEFRNEIKPQRYILNKVFFLNKSLFFNSKRINAKDLNLHKITRNIWGNWQYINDKLTPVLRDFKNQFNEFYELHFDKNRSKLIQLIKSIHH